MRLIIQPPPSLEGNIQPPGDKSISHRAAIIGALAEGTTVIDGFLAGADCLSTLNCLRALGVDIAGPDGGRVVVRGGGLDSLKEPETVLDAGNSGTTMRLLLGVLAGQPFYSVINGDESLRRRPMVRVTGPLRSMGAAIWGRQNGELAPLSVRGGKLEPLAYTLPVASAQVKSALLLAGLFTSGETIVTEPCRSRDHSERMLRAAGADLRVEGLRVRIRGRKPLKPLTINVPGDISAAAFFLVAGCLHPRAALTLEKVNLNPTRTGIIDVLTAMGAPLEIIPGEETAGEPAGSIRVTSGRLHGLEVGGAMIPRLIDEIPVLAVAAALAEGETLIRDAAELKVKESDRIAMVAGELARMGAEIYARPDGFRIKGVRRLRGAVVDSHGDHRLAMALAMAGLVAEGTTEVRGAECIAISYPGFTADLARLGVMVKEEDD
ncbi:3-phosphoshikimate 1-carboxyvinyltransferase 1 [Moorella thermoacetica]|uniref:3-phosphoshikimate 1-carboxyvinyltransferase n=1 Tax=Neomoorella thermoacetica TaxID=1525 RepID=A0A1J5JP39_NEOTH|nr:3-phosphoshikimate 1-carboxyvinyltransferase [Moorella thermoacetica]OIQ08483.1 3-phosphoshikimate 1-carboxyvinyltransferase 1 [Moorella thermoacetica]